MKVHYITKHPTSIRATELAEAARSIGIDFEITYMDSTHSSLKTLPSRIDGDAVMWNSAHIPKMHSAYATLNTYLHYAHDTIILNRGYITQPLVRYKYYQYALASSIQGVSMVTTYVGFNAEDIIRQGVTFPLICKPSHGSEGKGIVRCDTMEDFQSLDIPFEEYIFQPFVENDGDNRVLTFGGIPFGVIKRIGNSYLHNLSLGGTAVLVEEGHEKIMLQNIASAAATLFQTHIAGVDVMYDIHEKIYYVQEINTTPQWQGAAKVLDISIPTHMLQTALYLHRRKTVPTHTLVQEYYDIGKETLGDERLHYEWIRTYFMNTQSSYLEEISDSNQKLSYDECIQHLERLYNRAQFPLGNNLKKPCRGTAYLLHYLFILQEQGVSVKAFIESPVISKYLHADLQDDRICTDSIRHIEGHLFYHALMELSKNPIAKISQFLLEDPVTSVHLEILLLIHVFGWEKMLLGERTEEYLDRIQTAIEKGLGSFTLESLLSYALHPSATLVLQSMIRDRVILSPLGNFVIDPLLPEQHPDNSFVFSARRSALYIALCHRME